VCALISVVVHSTFGNPFACTDPEAATNTVTLYVLRQVSGTFGCSLGSWRHMVASTKHTTVTCKLAHSKKCIYNVTNNLTAWSRTRLEKLTGPQLVKNFLAFYLTQIFITAFTRHDHLFLPRATSMKYLSYITSWRPFLVVSTHLT